MVALVVAFSAGLDWEVDCCVLDLSAVAAVVEFVVVAVNLLVA